MFLIGVGGPSESGKSHGTQYLEEKHGTTRLKLVKVLASIYRQHVDASAKGFDGWPFRVQVDQPDWLVKRLIDWFGEQLSPHAIVTIESLYGPTMSDILSNAANHQYELWFIDAPTDMRVFRQQKTRALATVEEARRVLRERDAEKKAAGLAALRESANAVINNNSDLDAYHDRLADRLHFIQTSTTR